MLFADRESTSRFHTFFSSIDNFKSAQLLYLTSMGVPATKRDMAIGSAGGVGGGGEEGEAAIDEPSSDDDAEPEDG